jgi:pimeloyl-ACP methyl ester carboxylesterase
VYQGLIVELKTETLEIGKLTWFYREAIPDQPRDQPPVLLLHGLVSQSYSWREVMPSLAERGFRAIAPDWIGHGYSSWSDSRDFAYTPDAFVTALGDFLAEIEIQRFSLVVQGFLGSVGLQYALRHPEQIERLSILNTPLSPSVSLPWKIRQMGLPLIGDMMTQDPLLVDRTLEGGGPYQIADKDLDIYRRPFLTSSSAGRALMATIKGLQLPQATAEISEGFKGWSQPTLVVWGDRDPWVPIDVAQDFTKHLQDGELQVLAEVGHYAQEDWPEKVCEQILPFLTRSAF